MFEKIISTTKLIFIPCEENGYRPKFLESRFLFYYLIVLLVLKLIIIPFLIYFPRTVFFADLTQAALIKFTNQEREVMGINPLKENPILNEAAYLKAKDMLEKDYFSHNSPEGISPWYWFGEVEYDYNYAGENLAIGFLDSEEVHQAWLNSPSHRKNLLNPNYQEIGIALARGDYQGNETVVVVQLFGSPKAVLAAPEPEIITEPQAEEEILPEITEEVLPREEELEEKVISGEIFPREEKPQNALASSFFSFMTFNYYNLVQKIIYGSLIFIIISLLINILVKFKIQHKWLILKTLGFILLLVLLTFLDKGIIIQIIPHNFSIY